MSPATEQIRATVRVLVQRAPADFWHRPELDAENAAAHGLKLVDAAGETGGLHADAQLWCAERLEDLLEQPQFTASLTSELPSPVLVLLEQCGPAESMRALEQGVQEVIATAGFSCAALAAAVQRARARQQWLGKIDLERRMLRMVIDNLPDPIYLKDTAGRYVFSNRAHLGFLGMDGIEQIEGKTVQELFPSEFAEHYRANDQQVLQDGRELINHEEDTVGADGIPRVVATSKVPLRDRLGRIIGLVGVARDITKRRRAEELARKYADDLAAQNEQMHLDIRMAAEIQQAYLMTAPLRFPEKRAHGPGGAGTRTALRLELAYSFLPIQQIGGDFYQVQPLGEHQLGILLCDVMGHGIRAALVTSLIHGVAHKFDEATRLDPGKFLSAMNTDLIEILNRAGVTLFTSAIYLVIDTEAGELSFGVAGHPSALHWSSAARGLIPWTERGNGDRPALGIVPGHAYVTERQKLNAGDSLLIYTDGIHEICGKRDEEYGEERLARKAAHLATNGPDRMIEELLREVRAYAQCEEFEDDVCLIAVKAIRA